MKKCWFGIYIGDYVIELYRDSFISRWKDPESLRQTGYGTFLRMLIGPTLHGTVAYVLDIECRLIPLTGLILHDTTVDG